MIGGQHGRLIGGEQKFYAQIQPAIPLIGTDSLGPEKPKIQKSSEGMQCRVRLLYMDQCQSGDMARLFNVNQSLSRKSTCGAAIGVNVRQGHISRNYIAANMSKTAPLIKLPTCNLSFDVLHLVSVIAFRPKSTILSLDAITARGLAQDVLAGAGLAE